MKVEVKVTLKESVLDPQGSAVQATLRTLGFEDVQNVRIGKTILLEVKPGDEAVIRKQVEEVLESQRKIRS